ncbi:MAG: hypothetical protein AAF703_06700 [Cyanobacteria bacterium P01_D01_bin.105]
MIRIRQFFTAVMVTFFTACIAVGAFLGVPFSAPPFAPLSAIAADYRQTQTDYSQDQQEAQTYASQSAYEQTEDASSDYASQQTTQTSAQEKQTNQASPSEQQYAQQEQTYLAK